MPVRSRIEIEASAADVWRLLADFRHWPEWGPTVRGVEADVDAIAPGVTGRVETVVGLWLPFEIGSVEPERFWDWSVAGISATGHRLEPRSARACAVEFSAPTFAAPYRLVLSAGLRRLKALAESGRGA